MPNATARTIGLLTFVAQIVGFFLEIPSGYISDKIGHKKALVFARVSMFLSTLCYVFADHILWFFAGAILLAVGTSFISGTVDAFMHDTLTTLKRDNEYAKVIGKMRSIGFAIPIVFILLLPVIAEVSFRLAFGVVLIIDVVGLIMALSLVNPPKETDTGETGVSDFFKIIPTFFKMPWARFAIFSSLAFGISLGATMGFKNPYQEMLGFSLMLLGILWAISRVFISLLLLYNGKIYEMFTFKQFIILRTLIYSVTFIGIGFVSNMWLVAGLFIIGNVAVWGLNATNSQYDLEYIKNSNSKAMLLSMKSFMRTAISGLVGLSMGMLIFARSYQEPYLIVGAILAAVALIAMVVLKNDRVPDKQIVI